MNFRQAKQRQIHGRLISFGCLTQHVPSFYLNPMIDQVTPPKKMETVCDQTPKFRFQHTLW